MSDDIFQFFTYKEAKVKMKSRWFIILVFYCSFNLEVMVKFQLRKKKKKKKFTAYLSLVTKFLDFVVKFFLNCLLSMMEI